VELEVYGDCGEGGAGEQEDKRIGGTKTKGENPE